MFLVLGGIIYLDGVDVKCKISTLIKAKCSCV